MQPDLFGGSGGRTDPQEILEENEADYSTEAIAVQLLLALLQPRPRFRPRRALDPCCGSGVWARAMRAIFGDDLMIAGVEIRESERVNVRNACNRSGIGDALGSLPRQLLVAEDGYDLIASNIPFEGYEHGWADNFRERGLLAPHGIILFYGHTQWGQADNSVPQLEAWSPAEQIRLGGRPQHRGKGTKRWAPIPKKRRVPGGPTHEWRENGGNSLEYCGGVWEADDYRVGRQPSLRTRQLPVLPIDLRRWTSDAVPGTRPIEQSLVDLIRGRYL
jgi:hypothetical protein